ncbi:probable N-acetyltransferase CML1 [Sinocyclocheilus rhinocerous]|uniref:Probable N-acetyltransferase CML1 n=1 Tax=Sinocyclocheilus rhinocerous TaxID=307959 RepID=A0A673KUH1_9TELE|nr:PREDICTED: probable N-acetyltransferase CML1 [Sinocyclocheilus rhinocerous]XP_016417679.1 PREDICTED: probable N-acetyltransferase CML1 [Sinocyclocheilus rhinocerous]XP_016417681.1 PREDICTED: probable N-acetyltransferase CML1 [Sinocyclocheilus rhinocerous]XP_016417682.1 PREDICTED: probable N-acetyltransferase CML1 [Sinocyclocheilus rhinocerous]
MAEVQIRRYREEDHEEVKEVFTLGMSEHIPSSCMHVLKQPLAQMFLGCVFCALLTSSMSILLPVLAVTLLLAAGRQSVSYMFTKYIQTCLEQDLSHIQQTYLDPPNACFWVAESQGRVVGTVACLPAEKDQNFLELKRMSVKKTHRGQGIAKTLCRTVADFARERGFRGVLLHTSVVQTDAQKLYEHMGYQKVSEFSAPEAIAKLTNFTLMEYQLVLKQHRN